MVRCILGLLVWSIIGATVPVLAAESLVIPGTGDSQALLQTVARAFEAGHPGTMIEIPESIGSSGGIKNVIAGNAVLARVARPLREGERQAGLKYRKFALSPVVFAANLADACVQNLSTDQVLGVYSGTIDNWAALGNCPSHVIYVANREPGDSSRSTIEAHLPAFLAIPAAVGETVYSTPETVEILQRYPYTIGYVPLAALQRSSITVLELDGTAPTTENIEEGRYPLVIPLGLVWKEELSPLAEQFIAYLFSPEGQQLIRSQGLVPSRPGR